MKREGPSIAFSLSPDPDLDNRSQLSGWLYFNLVHVSSHAPTYRPKFLFVSAQHGGRPSEIPGKVGVGKRPMPWPAREKRRLLLCRHLPVQSRAVEYHCLSVGVRANLNFYFLLSSTDAEGQKEVEAKHDQFTENWPVACPYRFSSICRVFFLNLGTSFFSSSPYRWRLIGLHCVFLLFNCLFLWVFPEKHF